MTLTNRLSLFFLAALAVVLAGFSAALYGLAHAHLLRQADERATAALDTLTAATEVEPFGLEWDPGERLLAVGGEGGKPTWAVFDERGNRLDGAGDASLFAGSIEPAGPGETMWEDASFQGEPWRVARRTLRANTPPGGESPGQGPGDKKLHRALVLAVGVPLAPVYGTLRTLASALAGLSLGTWVVALLAGRWLSRGALAPVAGMARAAHAISAADLGQRLPMPGTGDELDELGGAFNELLARLQGAFERQRRFTGEASHQLRTPLTAMLGQVEVALRRERPPEEYRRALGSVQKQAGRMRQVLEALLFLARADAEAKPPETERFDLAPWLAEHLQGWAGHPRSGDLRYEPAAEPLRVRAHPALLAQAVDNLLDNACKYSEPGSPVVVKAWREGDEVCLAVEDRGFGVAAEELPHLFEPFFRSPEARRRGVGGVGLGLAVAARIVAAFGGRIEATSRAGEGSRFVIRLRYDGDGQAGG